MSTLSTRRREIIQSAIQSWLDGNGNELLLAELPALEKLYREISVEESDFRSGSEVYGYYSPDEIRVDMEYISDRWMAAYRVKWIIDGLRNGKI